jgi:hypothetical protein
MQEAQTSAFVAKDTHEIHSLRIAAMLTNVTNLTNRRVVSTLFAKTFQAAMNALVHLVSMAIHFIFAKNVIVLNVNASHLINL